MTMEDGDLKQRLRLAQEKIIRLEQENAELLDMRDLLMVLAKVMQHPIRPKKSPAVRRAEMARLWAAKSEQGPS